MRENKFRGLEKLPASLKRWHPGLKPKMVYGTGIFKDGTNTWLLSHDETKPLVQDMTNHIIDPETVGRFTGHKDRNGKEIYEGDKCMLSHGFITLIGKIKQEPNGEWILYKDKGNYLSLYHNLDKINIIGNIHEE